MSFLVASVVYVLVRPPAWLAMRLLPLRRAASNSCSGEKTSVPSAVVIPEFYRPKEKREKREEEEKQGNHEKQDDIEEHAEKVKQEEHKGHDTHASISSKNSANPPTYALQIEALPPPPAPSAVQDVPDKDQDPTTPTTPKASAMPSFSTVPTLSLSTSTDQPPATTSSLSSTMPPPPLPNRRPPPTLAPFPAPNSAQRARGPLPPRGITNNNPTRSSSSLAPPPTLSSKPAKPSRKITLEPGHSPLDWARISGPNADLRGIQPPPPSLLRVTPSMLKNQTGRRGKDAWMALNGRVYNVTPYAAFHPGGIPELMRGAARDGTKLFGEVHPWVNYETMLAACLVGILVDEPVGGGGSAMDEMD
ncbi:hypothetical protein E4U57_007339 [Claviceps arundinis]|uniref:Cytochrome b5 heme-binding domain-containing protein n=1 Tax=Claviceps arundinis TaxID=1623583 RepID=A0ABQ7PFJ8_9HYPO|nr:hypothetical protein E4U57_007339 [Claviceps arundinis]